jgi:hypothetical protein
VRAEIVLKAENFKVEMLPIHRHRTTRALSARYISALPGFSKLMTPSLLPTSGDEHPLRRRGNASQGAGPLQSPRVEVRASRATPRARAASRSSYPEDKVS